MTDTALPDPRRTLTCASCIHLANADSEGHGYCPRLEQYTASFFHACSLWHSRRIASILPNDTETVNRE